MKIESNGAVFKINLGEREEEVFQETVLRAMGIVSDKPVIAPLSDENIDTITNSIIEKVKAAVSDDIMEDVKVIIKSSLAVAPEQTTSNQSPAPSAMNNKRFVIGMCSCSEQHYLNVYRKEDGTYDVVCRACGRQYSLPFDELIKMKVDCPDCGNVHYFYIHEKLKPAYISCKQCGKTITIRPEHTFPPKHEGEIVTER